MRALNPLKTSRIMLKMSITTTGMMSDSHTDTRFDPSLPPELPAAPLVFGARAQAQLLADQSKSEVIGVHRSTIERLADDNRA